MVLTAASVVAGLMVAGTAKADFTGYYNTGGSQILNTAQEVGAYWLAGNSVSGNGGLTGGTGSAVISIYPSGTQIQITGTADGGIGGAVTEFYVPINPITPGVISFNWGSTVASGVGGNGDSTGYYYNPTGGADNPLYYHLLKDNNTVAGSGFAAQSVAPGGVFAFYVISDANVSGPISPVLSVSGFAETAGVPEPATYVMNGLVLLGIGIGGFMSYRKSKKAKV